MPVVLCVLRRQTVRLCAFPQHKRPCGLQQTLIPLPPQHHCTYSRADERLVVVVVGPGLAVASPAAAPAAPAALAVVAG